jgi:CHAT domain-containing protein/tetratricopeptide (TPR) repeat protein
MYKNIICRLFNYLLIVVFVTLCTKISGQAITKQEKKADSLATIEQYDPAMLLYKDILKQNINDSDRLRILIKITENAYFTGDSISMKTHCSQLSGIFERQVVRAQNRQLESHLLFLWGKYYELEKKYEKAGSLIDSAIDMRDANNCKDSLYAVMLSMRGLIYYKKNEYKNCISYYRASIRHFIKNKIYDKNILLLLLNEAYIRWSQNELDMYKRIIDLAVWYVEHFKIEDKYKALTYMNIGSYNLYKTEYLNAYKSYAKVLTLKNIDLETILQSKYYVAFSLKILGDYLLSNQYYHEIIYKSKFVSKEILINSYNKLSLNYLYNERLDSSLYFLNICESENNRFECIKKYELYHTRARIYSKALLKDSSIFYFKKAEDGYLLDNKINISFAIMLVHFGRELNTSESKQIFDEALKISLDKCGIKHSRTAYIFNEIGIYRYERGQYREALDDFQQALISVDMDFDSRRVTDNPICTKILSAVNLAKALKYKSLALEQLYNETDSTAYLMAAFNTAVLLNQQIEKMLSSYPLFESREFLLSNSASLYKKAQGLAYRCWQKTGDIYYADQILFIAEQSRAAILKAQLQDNNFYQSVLNDSLSRRLQELEQNIAYLTGQINEYVNSGNKSQLSSLNNELFDMQEQKNKILESQKGEYGHFSSFFNPPRALSLAQIKAYAGPGVSILEYSLCDSIIFLNLLKNGKNELYTIAYTPELKNRIKRYQELLVPKNDEIYQTEYFQLTKQTGAYLYDALIGQAGDKLKGSQLLIVQDPAMGFLPFESFVNNDQYLIEQYAISYLYSVSVSSECRKLNLLPDKARGVAFFPDYHDKNPVQNHKAAAHYKNLIPFDNRAEQDYLSENTSYDIFTGREAGEKEFKENARFYSLIHLSLHGLVDTANYNLSKLCFTPCNDSIDEGILNLCDIAPLRLNALLTVLSGCNTGSGRAIEGEGAMSFARSFILAGSKSILMSLWELDNRTANEISQGFYSYLAQGYNKTEALQRAKKDYLAKADMLHRHPYFWSALVLVGDPQAIEIPQHTGLFSNIYLIAGIILCVIAALYFIRKKYGCCCGFFQKK